MSVRKIDAPAKINLGLEILGKRRDGYHEVRTVLAAISLFDELVFDSASESYDSLRLEPDTEDIPSEANLVTKALSAMREAGADIPPQRISIVKRIPAAAGFGGASSDAAATLRAFSPELATAEIDAADLAVSLGSDVPFFLNGPVALAAGRGEALSPLPRSARDVWVVLAMPDLEIPEKTRTMYSAIDPAWWSDGSRAGRIAENLPTVPTSAPFNVFERALLRIHPELEIWRRGLREAGFPFVALTGAGPTHYTLALSQEQARDIQAQLSSIGVQAITACLLSRWEGADDQ
ncbi:MAG TPA: 4-(cytidine 5'-diphospho)-2-C-methyl-D-erythritol kinase [Thermomicrobiales bacterium]|nr:4-(cytidine 5'-diphospho)-2-C-methyl-D-erythritol kinase [Thermomicrobiales bacterium]